jgi:type IV pilus assembly protein PilA
MCSDNHFARCSAAGNRAIRLRVRLWERTDRTSDAGFTLIELMVVLLILAILLAIAIPTFLGVTKSANDRAAQSNLNTALINAKATYQSQGQSYFSTTVTTPALFATALGNAQPSLHFSTASSTDQSHLSVQVSTDGNSLILAAYSKPTSNCWYAFDNPSTPTQTTDPPWTGAATLTGVTATTTIIAPSTLGTTYAEVKGDTSSTDCSAATPTITAGSTGGNAWVYQTSPTSFPS